jgi:CRP-like cAMP-binding protein
MHGLPQTLECVLSRLARGSALSEGDKTAFLALPFRIETVAAHKALVREGEPVDLCCMLLGGFVARHKMEQTGKRQIVSFHQAGDIVDLQHLFFSTADHTVEAITPATVAWVADEAIRGLLRERPLLAEAVWREAMIDASVFREWVLNIGRRDAKARIAHMLCEVAKRAEAAGLGSSQGFELPLTQDEIADATGLTGVHVNRMIRDLIGDGAIARHGRTYVIADWARMCEIADFEESYLHQSDTRLARVA